MINQNISEDQMYQALLDKNPKYEGLFVIAVKTTGIFCRTTCTARKPNRRNVEFFNNPQEALGNGYRPCKICRPMEYKDEAPQWLKPLLEEIDQNPDIRLKDHHLRQRGIEPNRARRWFKRNHNMTLQAYLRLLRIGNAAGRIKHGEKVVDTAFDSGYESLSGFGDSFKKLLGCAPSRSKEKTVVKVTRILTPLGPMFAGAVEEGICLLEFVDRRMLETQLKRLTKLLNAEFLPGAHPLFQVLDTQLKEYFARRRRDFELPVITPGTSFQQQVWAQLRTIPYGGTRSYKEQAEAVGNPAAIRAVAKANGDNRISIIIPCHRVIGHDGQMVGYGGGIQRKKYLLNLETGN